MIKNIFPACEWIRTYPRADFSRDLSAGILVAVMLVPQGMAYAMLAGLPPVTGLYASTLPLIAYAVFGSSRHLAVGPVAIMSLLVFAEISAVAEVGSERYFQLVLLLSFMVGAIQLVLGLLRMGFLVNFFSHAVISGFSSAAAIIIFLSQLHHLVGIELKSKHSVFQILMEAGARIGETNLVTVAIGVAGIVLLILFRRWMPRFPAALLIVTLSTLVVFSFRLDRAGVKIIGNVPQGLPGFSFPPLSMESFGLLLPTALTLVFIGFMEAVSVAKLIAAKEKYRIDSNQELRGLGLANLAASFFSAFPVTGGFSRTAVNYEAGARTGIASLMTAGLIVLILLFFTSLFYYLPQAVLASIVMVSVFGLIDIREALHLFKIKKMDGWILLMTFLTTLGIGSEEGILLGIVFSLCVFIWRSAHPHTAELGYLEGEEVFRNLKRFPKAETYPKTLILRVDASLYFANMGFLEDLLRKMLAQKQDVQWVVLDFSGVNDIDAVAIDRIEEIMDHYRDRRIRFLFAGMKGPVHDLVAKAAWEEKYPEKIQFHSVEEALREVGLWDRP